MKATRCLFIIGLACLFQGCWVRLPSSGPAVARVEVGKTATVQKDLYLYHDGWGTSAVERARLDDVDMKNVIATLHPGEKVKIVSIASRRLPRGLMYYFVMRPLDRNKKFTFDRCFQPNEPWFLYPDPCISFDPQGPTAR